MVKKTFEKSSNKFFCEKCDYYTNRFSQYERHLQTKKHNGKNGILNGNEKGTYICECGKSYKYQPGLSRHKKTCTYVNLDENIILDDSQTITSNNNDIASLLMKLIDTNEDLKEQIIDLASKPRTINNQNTFNLNNFLNIQCRDAMNLSEFLEQIQITFQDLLYLGNNGFVEAFKDTFIKQLKSLDQTMRPIHCTDQKRKACVVKENDKWEKENTNEIIYNAVEK